jgi:glucosamine-6-phosphate deaminase
MMDEYLGAPEDAHYACRRFAREEIAGPLGIDESRLWLPAPDDPAQYDARIDAAGGVETFLLGCGATDGHVGFVPPGAARDGDTAVFELAETTRRDNLETFPEFRSLEDVPTHGVSVGLGTIARARSLRIVLHGAGKRRAAARLRVLRGFDASFPASIVHDHPEGEIWLDRAALG